MYLKDILIFMNESVRDRIYRTHFGFHVFFIEYCLTKQLRLKKNKFETDGTFDTIFIEVGTSSSFVKHGNSSLLVALPFDFELYDNSDDMTRCRYYIDLVKKALQILSEKKNIPYEKLMEFLTTLADNNYIYSWDFKNVIVPEHNLKIRFTCQLSTNDFIMKLVATDKKSKIPICEGTAIRTLPDDIYFSDISKNIKIRDGEIIISSTWGRELLSINLTSLVSGHLVVDFCPSPYPDNVQATEIFKSLQKYLKYDNNNFD